MSEEIKKGVFKKGKTIIKDMGKKDYENETFIYSLNLPYTPKLISKDPDKKTITISYVCCKRWDELTKEQKEKYKNQLKKLFFRFKKDTGYYHGDFAQKNIMVDTEKDKIYLIDFARIVKTKNEIIGSRGDNILNLLDFLGIKSFDNKPKVHGRYT